MIPRTNHNTHRTTFVISSRTGCCRATKSTRITTKTSNRPIYQGPQRTCLCSIYHAIYGRDTTDQNEHVCSTDSTSQHITEQRRAERRKVHELPRKLDSSYTNYHENSTSVLGPDVSERVVIARTRTCCSTDQNIFVISELLTKIITHHTSYTYTHLNSTSQHITERRRCREHQKHHHNLAKHLMRATCC